MPRSDHELQTELLALERQGWDALCGSTGDSFYGRAMTEDAVMVLVNGEVMDRDAVVASLGEAPPWRTYDIGEARLVRTGPDSAALVYRATAHREADEPAFVALMSSVYVRQNDEWRLALYQQTAVPADNVPQE